jgi:hypothetical protein
MSHNVLGLGQLVQLPDVPVDQAPAMMRGTFRNGRRPPEWSLRSSVRKGLEVALLDGCYPVPRRLTVRGDDQLVHERAANPAFHESETEAAQDAATRW